MKLPSDNDLNPSYLILMNSFLNAFQGHKMFVNSNNLQLSEHKQYDK